jgi:hypothetical protein
MSKFWYRLILNDKVYNSFVKAIPEDAEIDVDGSNQAVIGELLLESIPQGCLVLYNSFRMDELTIVVYITIIGSAAIIVNCLFKFGYWLVWRGVPLRHIPLSGRPLKEHIGESHWKHRMDNYLWGRGGTESATEQQYNSAIGDAESQAGGESNMEDSPDLDDSSGAIELGAVPKVKISVSEDIRRLYQLKLEGVLDDEQYKLAVAKAVRTSQGKGTFNKIDNDDSEEEESGELTLHAEIEEEFPLGCDFDFTLDEFPVEYDRRLSEDIEKQELAISREKDSDFGDESYI